MKNIHFYLGSLLLVLGSIFTACGPDARLDLVGMFAGTSPTIDKRVEESLKYNEQHGFVTLQAPSDDYRVYVCTDTHIHKTRTRWQYFIDTYHADQLCPVAVHLGDLIDARTDFQYIQDALSNVNGQLTPAKDTLMAVIGNHDIYFKQWPNYIAAFKTSTYYFVVTTPSGARDLYIVYDSADGTLGTTQLKWLTETLEWADTQKFRHIVCCSHTHFFKRDGSQGTTGNYTLEESFALLDLFSAHGVEMFWSGHDHNREITQAKSITCIVLDSMTDRDKEAFYMLVTMGDKISYDFIPVP